MASRPLHFIWLLDCSGSMGVNGKISQLNYAIREAIPEMRKAADDNPGAELLVRAITFSAGAAWHLPEPTPVADFAWEDVHATSTTDLGAALRLVTEALKTPPMPGRALRPVLALVSDGLPTDDWRSALRAMDATPWGKRAVRVAIGIGEDADKDMLKEYLNNPEQEPLRVKNPKQLVAAIRWASTVAVANASSPLLDKDQRVGPSPDQQTTITNTAVEPDVW
ncbi:tellurium resistance protein [Streptomyces sp. DSM 44915]|uniref:Tellurium resistance protein n=1 Tax=Streptomyces chisholmiae TaxID=3075540 RepID=A0ABU2JPK4_9ACTN|nr:tellurium resistance protein [Streptomyces sp. DSM 44915]MDT0266661.1 tellurium resistance protein [Streptomyces sp. DSM 44915]